MKKTFSILLTAAMLMACGGADPTDLGKKRRELDSLKTTYKELGVKIKDLEAWLAERDTTVRRNLPVVTRLELKPATFVHYVDVHGVVKADRSAALFALMGGRIRAVHVSAGDRVQQGQLLVSIDNDVVGDQIKQARSAYELAQITYEKQKSLWDQQIGSEIQYLQAKAQMDQARSAVSALEEQQRLTNVTAPFDGTVDDVMVRPGDMASPQMPVARVVDLSGAQLEADMPEGYLGRVKKDAPALVHFPSVDTTFNAHVEHVGSYIDPSNRTFKLVVHVQEGGIYIRPNLLSNISVEDSRTDSALVVPAEALLQDVEGHDYLFAVDAVNGGEGIARKVMVERVAEYKGRVHIRPREEGALASGASIIHEGAKNVSNGQAVRLAN